MFASCSCDVMLCWPRGLGSRGRNVSIGNTVMTPPNRKWGLPLSHFGLRRRLNHQAEKGIMVLAGLSDPAGQGDPGQIHGGGKQENVWNPGDPLWHRSVSPCSVMQADGKQQQSNPGHFGGPHPPAMKVGVTSPGKGPPAGRGLLKAQVLELRQWKTVAVNTSCSPTSSYRNEDCGCHKNASFLRCERVCV